jgi:hypothetical protein
MKLLIIIVSLIIALSLAILDKDSSTYLYLEKIYIWLFVLGIVFVILFIAIKIQAGKDINEKKEKNRQDKIKLNKKLNEDKILKELFQTVQEGIDHNAMYELAERYFIGNGLEKNYVEAMYWIYKAEVLGNSNAPTLRNNIEMVASDIQISVAHNKLAIEGK